MDTNKVRFLYWLNFYHNIYIRPEKERPRESIINNDVLLDEYVRIQVAKANHPPKTGRNKSGGETITFEE